MKLDKQRILSMFATFTDLPCNELASWDGLCESAQFKITERLKENVDVAKNMERLCIAAAACAYLDYTMLKTGTSSSSDEIRVGDISLKSSEDTVDATSTRDYFMDSISDLISPPASFAFKSTGGAL